VVSTWYGRPCQVRPAHELVRQPQHLARGARRDGRAPHALLVVLRALSEGNVMTAYTWTDSVFINIGWFVGKLSQARSMIGVRVGLGQGCSSEHACVLPPLQVCRGFRRRGVLH